MLVKKSAHPNELGGAKMMKRRKGSNLDEEIEEMEGSEQPRFTKQYTFQKQRESVDNNVSVSFHF